MENKELVIGAGILVLALIVAIFVIVGNTVSDKEMQKAIDDTKATANADKMKALSELEGKLNDKLAAIESSKADLAAAKEAAEAEKAALATQLSDKDAEYKSQLDDLNAKLSDLEQAQTEIDEEEQTVTDALGEVKYLIDELELGATVPNKDLSDRELKTLLDMQIEFDNDDYDVEEVFSVYGMKVSINEPDYDGNTYLTVPEEGIVYEVRFDSELDTSTIDDDETLVFSFLGKEVTISDWNVDKVTFTTGTEKVVKEGETITTKDGVAVTFTVIGNDFVYVTVGDESNKIDEGKTKTVGGVDIKADVVIENEAADGPDMAIVLIGTDVEETVEDGDEYAEDSPWEYVITADSIGIKLVEEFVSIDPDDDYLALEAEDILCLPNAYVCVRYDGPADEDYNEYAFDLKTKSGNDYVRVLGDFIVGLEDYDEIYINDSGIYDEDLDLIATSSIELKDSDLVLDLLSANMLIDDVKIKYDLTQIKVDGDNISGFDETYLTTYGIMIDNPEDAVDDQEVTLNIPEDKVQTSVTILA